MLMRFAVATAVAVLLTLTLTAQSPSSNPQWLKDETAAKERAAGEGALILAFRADDACTACTRLMREALTHPIARPLLQTFVLWDAPAPSGVRISAVWGRGSISGVNAPSARQRSAAVSLLDADGNEMLTWTAKNEKGTVIDAGTFVDILQRASAAAPHLLQAARLRSDGRMIDAWLALGLGYRQAKERDRAIEAYDEAIREAHAQQNDEAAQSATIVRELVAASRGSLAASIAALRGIAAKPVSRRTEAEAWLALGQLLQQDGKPRDSAEALERAVKLADAAPEAAEAAAQLLDASGNRLIGGTQAIRVLVPERAAYSGKVTVQALVRDPSITSVAFLLDGRKVADDAQPPFDAVIDAGEVPRRRELSIVARNADGAIAGEDALVLNDRYDAFSIRLTLGEKRTAQAIVDLPEGSTLESVEFFLDDRRLARLAQPPFRVAVGDTGEGSVLRTTARLTDGRFAEDVLLVGTGSELLEVREVEMFVTVHDARDAIIPNLARSQFSVREEGKPRTIAGFAYSEDAPFTVGLAVDSSSSMRSRIADVHESATSFLRQIAEGGHTAFVVDFDTKPRLLAGSTADADPLLRAIASIRADGATALHDALVFSLLQLQGVGGKRALIAITDGRDFNSRSTMDDVVRVARETGATIYLVALSPSINARLRTLASESGGRVFDLRTTKQLAEVYDTIHRELSRQYRINFRTDAKQGWRAVTIGVDVPGARVRSASGFVAQ